MEEFPLTPSLHYNILPLVIVLMGCIFGILYLEYRSRAGKLNKYSENVTQTKGGQNDLSKHTLKQQKAITLGYLDKLEEILRVEPEADIVGIYTGLSSVIRKHVDMTEGTHTITMTNEELRELPLDEEFKEIINECYAVEFSPSPASASECKLLIAKAKRFVAA